MIRKLLVSGSLAIVLALTAYGQDQSQAPPSTAASSMAVPAGQDANRPALQHRYRYVIERSDAFALQFPLVPEYNQAITVQPDGYIYLQDVGEMYVLGKTLPDLTDSIRTAYSKILHEPIISVNMTDFQKPFFTVLGEVQKPGKYELREDITVVQALSIGGGLTHDAKHSAIILFHHTENGIEVHQVDAKHMLSAQMSLTEDVHLQPGDIIWIPTSFNSKMIKKIQPFLPFYGASLGISGSTVGL
jgi:polysaccharide export outer membrane protein